MNYSILIAITVVLIVISIIIFVVAKDEATQFIGVVCGMVAVALLFFILLMLVIKDQLAAR